MGSEEDTITGVTRTFETVRRTLGGAVETTTTNTGDPPPEGERQDNAPDGPPSTREEAQEGRKGLIQAIIAGDVDAVNHHMGRFEQLAARFGMQDLFAQIKGIVDSLMATGSPISADNQDLGRVTNGLNHMIDGAMPPPEAGPVNTR